MRGKEDEVKRAKKEVMERWKERTLEEIDAEAKGGRVCEDHGPTMG